MSRLTIDITDTQHQNLKAMAALQGKTIKQFAIERLFPGPATSDQDWIELRSLLGQRVAEGLAGEISPHDVETILDDELGRDTAN